ncbi:MAG TPA: TIGR03009 domain-containing protein [Gemmata sp.]|nr:TIGR03009 domain-containing protein [Gemmata sp.]
MRLAGFILAVMLVVVASAEGQQPGGGTSLPPANKDSRLETHLNGWQKKMAELQNFRFVMSLKRVDAVFKKEKPYSGVVLCMKPNYAVLRMNNDSDRTATDYEAYICDGKAIYEYNGIARTITHYKLPDSTTSAANATDNLMLDFLSGMKVQDMKERFEISLYKEDEKGYYVYIDVKPKLAKDKAEFAQLRMALYGPNTKWTYLPAQVYMVKPSGDTEMWTFKDPQTNIPGLTAKDFGYQKVDGFRLVEGKTPTPTPPGRPGMPMLPGRGTLPPGQGAVRPNK